MNERRIDELVALVVFRPSRCSLILTLPQRAVHFCIFTPQLGISLWKRPMHVRAKLQPDSQYPRWHSSFPSTSIPCREPHLPVARVQLPPECIAEDQTEKHWSLLNVVP